MHHTVVQVALASLLRQSFDYLLSENTALNAVAIGSRVKVPFRKGVEIGVIVAVRQVDLSQERPLKAVLEILDNKAILPAPILALTLWASQYYHHPLGDCVMSALPVLLRQGVSAQLKVEPVYLLTPEGIAADLSRLFRAPQQAVALAALKQHPEGCTTQQLKAFKLSKISLNALVKKAWVQIRHVPIPQLVHIPNQTSSDGLNLNSAQQAAVTTVTNHLTNFQTFLLYGVTGSGKTEVYLQIIAQVLAAAKQALILVPEIGLTPQIVERFQQRFKVTVVALHSGLTDRERLNGWLLAKTGGAAIIIGTRSAIFTPLLKPGIIILDEEHDPSFKQQEGFRYSARDLAIIRGRMENIAVVLGSATPSLESFHNACQQRYNLLKLPERAGSSIQPRLKLIDIKNQALAEGILSKPLLRAIDAHLAADGQVLLFLNRRGFAPVMLCHSCGWIANCQHCDARLTYHQKSQRLHCHHCGANQTLITTCPVCKSSELIPVGFGTERLEQALSRLYNPQSIIRIDRDSTRRKGALDEIFTAIHNGQSRILVGTQMLAKGHHFPNVTLVGILNADSGLYSVDFRALERLAQLIIQVAGRAGRADKPGEVLIQTHNPQHPLLHQLITGGFLAFAEPALVERQAAQLPPYSYQVLIRAEATTPNLPKEFLKRVKALALNNAVAKVQVLGPIAALMARRGGHYREQLLLQSSNRQALQSLLNILMPQLEKLKLKKQVRYSVDVDPIDIV